MNKRQALGFTLIEVLVALTIISIAMLAVIKATGQAIRSQTHLQNKTLAMWVGSQIANEWRMGLLKMQDASAEYKTTVLNHPFYWRASVTVVPNSQIEKFSIRIFENAMDTNPDQSPLETLLTYRYRNIKGSPS